MALLKRILTGINLIFFIACIVINHYLKNNIENLGNSESQNSTQISHPLNQNSNSDETNNAAPIPIESNINKILGMLANLSKVYINTIQVDKIEYSIEDNIAKVSIKSFELKDLNECLIKLNQILEQNKSAITEISFWDKKNRPIDQQEDSSSNKPKKQIPFVLAYLQAKNLTQDNNTQNNNKSNSQEEDNSYNYKAEIKISL
jgi:hypothetical protein